EQVVRAGRLLDEHGLESCKLVDPLDGLVNLPDLIGVNHDVYVITDGFARDAAATDVVIKVFTHFKLDALEPLSDSFATQHHQLLVVISKPASRGGIGGKAVTLQVRDALVPAVVIAPQDRQRLIARQHIAQVTKIQCVDKLLRRQITGQTPDRLA